MGFTGIFSSLLRCYPSFKFVSILSSAFCLYLQLASLLALVSLVDVSRAIPIFILGSPTDSALFFPPTRLCCHSSAKLVDEREQRRTHIPDRCISLVAAAYSLSCTVPRLPRYPDPWALHWNNGPPTHALVLPPTPSGLCRPGHSFRKQEETEERCGC